MNEAIVDLKTSTIISIKNIPNVTGMGLEADDSLSDAIVRSDPNWIALLKKHGISINSVSRRATNLVIKYFTTIENYDYGFIWRFKEDGTLVYPYPATTSPATTKTYDGLPQWTSANRPISNTDLVLWYVAGITHIVRPEEWPVMPVHHLGFSLIPFGFFSSNPALKHPQSFVITHNFSYICTNKIGL